MILMTKKTVFTAEMKKDLALSGKQAEHYLAGVDLAESTITKAQDLASNHPDFEIREFARNILELLTAMALGSGGSDD